MQRTRNPTSWTPSRFRSMCRPARFRSRLFDLKPAHLQTSAIPLHAKDPQPDFVDAIPISVYLSAGKVSFAPLRPETHTCSTSTIPLHAKDLQPDFVDAIPISVYVSASKVPIEAPRSVVFKNMAHLGISKHYARYAPASPSGQGARPPRGPLKVAARAVC